MKKPIVILILISLLVLDVACLGPTKTQSQSVIGVVTINSDGSITPQVTQIKQTGNTYTLTSDLNAQVQFFLKKSNMVFDGNGHVLGNGRVGNIVIGYYNGYGVTNVTIKNFFINQTSTDVITVMNSANISIQNNTLIGAYSIFEQTNGVFLKNSSSVRIIGNTVKGLMCGIDLIGSKDNLIVGNTVDAESGWTWSHFPAAIMIDLYYAEVDTYSNGSSNNLIFGNSFKSNHNLTEIFGASSNSWDNGTIGNYWGNYLTKYPSAVEVDGSGIGNTPYVIDSNNVDHYPLMSQENVVLSVPIAVSETPILTPTLSSEPSPTSIMPNYGPTSSPAPTVPEFPAALALTILIIIVLAVAVVFRRKTK